MVEINSLNRYRLSIPSRSLGNRWPTTSSSSQHPPEAVPPELAAATSPEQTHLSPIEPGLMNGCLILKEWTTTIIMGGYIPCIWDEDEAIHKIRWICGGVVISVRNHRQPSGPPFREGDRQPQENVAKLPTPAQGTQHRRQHESTAVAESLLDSTPSLFFLASMIFDSPLASRRAAFIPREARPTGRPDRENGGDSSTTRRPRDSVGRKEILLTLRPHASV
jgi:hypothetical protein